MPAGVLVEGMDLVTTVRALASLITGLYLPQNAERGYLSPDLPPDLLDRGVHLTRQGNGIYRLDIDGETAPWILFSRRRAPRNDAVRA